MENDPNQQPPRDQPQLTESAPIDQVPVITKAPSNYDDSSQSTDNVRISPGPGSYVSAGLAILVLLAILLPSSSFAQDLGLPIIILGAVAGSLFFARAIRTSSSSNALLRPFLILGGFGVGSVIFIICLIAGLVTGIAKNPNPQSTG